jgi:hypothetical protein
MLLILLGWCGEFSWKIVVTGEIGVGKMDAEGRNAVIAS